MHDMEIIARRVGAVVIGASTIAWLALTQVHAAGAAPPRSPIAAAGTTTAIAFDPASSRALLDKYCVTCHNPRLQIAGLSLTSVDLTRAGEHAEILEKVARKLRQGAMPPP